MSKAKKAPQAEQLSLLESIPSGKAKTVNVVPVAEKQMNEYQAKQFTYMLDRMEAFRYQAIMDAFYATKREHEKTEVDVYLQEQFLKDLKSGKIVPVQVEKGEGLEIGSASKYITEQGKKTAVNLDTVVFHFKDLYFVAHHRDKLKAIEQAKESSIKELKDSTAFYRIRLRTGNMTNTEANTIIETLMEAWSVPMTIVAEANASNRSCTR